MHSNNGTNTIYNQQMHQHAIPCNCVNLVANSSDSSTVSSTVSEPTTAAGACSTDVMSLGSPGGGGATTANAGNEETGWRFIVNNKPASSMLVSGEPNADMAMSTPTSFTHFVLPVSSQAGLPSYELYNCLQNNHTTLLGLKRFGNLAPVHPPPLPPPPPAAQSAGPNDHVYCEIPSTIGRSSFRTLLQQPTGNSNKNSHFKPASTAVTNGNNLMISSQQHSSNGQNTSTSLLLSSSASSSNSTSPQSAASNFLNANKFTTNASII